MHEFVLVLCGLGIGTLVIGASFLWAFWPRKSPDLSFLAPPSGQVDSGPSCGGG